MVSLKLCCWVGIVAITAATANMPGFSKSQTAIQTLPDGEYMFASQLPDTSRHPDIQLAGAEIYIFQKRGDRLLGEHFISNSSEANCFRGRVKGNAIAGEGLEFDFGSNRPKPVPFKISVDLQGFNQIPVNSLKYARDSIRRCTAQFDNVSK